jgi:hypothetical protein
MFATYTQSVVQQAADRKNRHVRTVPEYLEVRRDTIGAKPSFAILELDMDLPDEVFKHPVMKELETLAIDMILLGNVSVVHRPRLMTEDKCLRRTSRATTWSKRVGTIITT